MFPDKKSTPGLITRFVRHIEDVKKAGFVRHIEDVKKAGSDKCLLYCRRNL